jgi:hypothetical protein
VLAGRVVELYESCTGLFEKFLVRGQRAFPTISNGTLIPIPTRSATRVAGSISRCRRAPERPMPSSWLGAAASPSDWASGPRSSLERAARLGVYAVRRDHRRFSGSGLICCIRPGTSGASTWSIGVGFRSLRFQFRRGNSSPLLPSYLAACLICRKHARISCTNISGCSNAAKWPPLSSSLK